MGLIEHEPRKNPIIEIPLFNSYCNSSWALFLTQCKCLCFSFVTYALLRFIV